MHNLCSIFRKSSFSLCTVLCSGLIIGGSAIALDPDVKYVFESTNETDLSWIFEYEEYGIETNTVTQQASVWLEPKNQCMYYQGSGTLTETTHYVYDACDLISGDDDPNNCDITTTTTYNIEVVASEIYDYNTGEDVWYISRKMTDNNGNLISFRTIKIENLGIVEDTDIDDQYPGTGPQGISCYVLSNEKNFRSEEANRDGAKLLINNRLQKEFYEWDDYINDIDYNYYYGHDITTKNVKEELIVIPGV